MEDVAVYNAYYGHYNYRAAEAASASPASRKQHGLVCVFLAFGAACGLSTVAVGFFAHNPAIIWPVVALGEQRLLSALGSALSRRHVGVRSQGMGSLRLSWLAAAV
jgi:hypothetical protein